MAATSYYAAAVEGIGLIKGVLVRIGLANPSLGMRRLAFDLADKSGTLELIC